jgi:Uma2 family endonuclease
MSTDFDSSSLPISGLPFPVPKYPVYRFSVAEYLAMADAGNLEHANVELLEGVVVPKMTRNSWHDATLGVVEEVIAAMLPQGYTTRVQMALVGRDSVPEPDVAIVRGSRRDYVKRRPTGADAMLVVEIADSSLSIDRDKASIYAAAGVPTYWIVNGRGQCIEVYRDPKVDAAGEFSYQSRQVFSDHQTIELSLDKQTLGDVGCNQLIFELPLDSDTIDPT